MYSIDDSPEDHRGPIYEDDRMFGLKATSSVCRPVQLNRSLASLGSHHHHHPRPPPFSVVTSPLLAHLLLWKNLVSRIQYTRTMNSLLTKASARAQARSKLQRRFKIYIFPISIKSKHLYKRNDKQML